MARSTRPGAPADGLVAAWAATRDATGRLAAGLPVKLAVGGPFAAAGSGCRGDSAG
jgi:hypothetical protein